MIIVLYDIKCVHFDMDLNNYHKYFALNEEDRYWGIHILDCGTTSIHPNTSNEYLDHPKKYTFNWEKGRILQEYQLIYVLNGKGQFESKACQKTGLESGDIVILFPGMWHRYKPDPSTYWQTTWIGFDGELARKLVPRSGLSPEEPLISVGYHQSILEIYNSIIDVSRSEFPGFQQILSGDVLKLLGWIHAIYKRAEFKELQIDSLMLEAKVLLRKPKKQLEQVARELNLGYSKFRKLFKDYTGLSPGQYRLQSMIKKAEVLLNDDQHNIQEICDLLGFESTQYFSRVFRNKTGKTPGTYRKSV